MKASTSRCSRAADEVLELLDVDELEVGYDEVLAPVGAASVNAADWHLSRAAPCIAIRHVEDGHTRGKSVITVPPFAASQTATTHHDTHGS